MKIKKFKKYFESISGTELINVGGVVGPGYGEEQLPITMTKGDTEILYSDITDEFYTQNDYEQLYQDYLKKNGKPLDGFNKKNLDTIVDYLKNAI